jgi:hypothetical protein
MDFGGSQRNNRELFLNGCFSTLQEINSFVLNESRSPIQFIAEGCVMRARIDGEGPVRRCGKDSTHSPTKFGRSSYVKLVLLARHDNERVWYE